MSRLRLGLLSFILFCLLATVSACAGELINATSLANQIENLFVRSNNEEGARRATVLRVHDGDTLHLAFDENPSTSLKVRLIGIDTPELDDPSTAQQAQRAKVELERLVNNNPIWVQVGIDPTDQYGRTLAYLWTVDPATHPELESMVNYQMIATGYAEKVEFKPNVEYAFEFGQAQRSARSQDLGLWKDGEFGNSEM